MEVKTISEISYVINCGNYVDYNEDILIYVELRIFNKRVITGQLDFEPFWNSMVCVMEMYGDSAHFHRPTKGRDLETTTNMYYVGKTLAGYKCGRPLTVLPRSISQLPRGLPINGVPCSGVPSQ